MRTAGPRRRATWTAAVLAVLVAVTTWPAGIATAAPGDQGPGDEGGSAELEKALEAASRGYLEAQTALETSKKRHAELVGRITELEPRIAALDRDVQLISATAYRTGGLRTAAVLLGSGSAEVFIDRVKILEMRAGRDARQLREFLDTRTQLTSTKATIDDEIVRQRDQLALMAKRKSEAERALVSVGGEKAEQPAPPKTESRRTPAKAAPAPRRPDGSWPAESCRLDDPTTSGCITARMAHALRQARSAGFNRFTSCYRPGGPYEHPRGRACDFAAHANGFGRVATGGDRTYGDNLAAYFVGNANGLAVLYVIWYERIWLPSSGWRAYRSGRGDPSSDHTDHVHLSVY